MRMRTHTHTHTHMHRWFKMQIPRSHANGPQHSLWEQDLGNYMLIYPQKLVVLPGI